MSRTLKERWEGLKAKFCEEELAFIEENSSLSRKAMFEAFQHRFRRADVSSSAIAIVRQHHGWVRFRIGAKGQPRTTRTREYVAPNGHVQVRVTGGEIGGKRTEKTFMKHRLLWEERHGPIPDGMVLKAVGPTSNPDPSNWTLVSVGMLGQLSNRKMAFNTLPEELQTAMLALAQIKITLRGSRVKGRKRA